jgi:flagellin-like protein
MSTLLKNKRGLSPLIATILLIAFAVAIGAVVMNIGRTTLIPDPDAKIFSILEVQGKQQICYFDKGTESLLEITLKNGADTEIVNLQLSIIGKKDINNLNNLLTQPIQKSEVKRVAVKYDGAAVGQLTKVIITPRVIEKGTPALKSSLEVENIPTC